MFTRVPRILIQGSLDFERYVEVFRDNSTERQVLDSDELLWLFIDGVPAKYAAEHNDEQARKAKECLNSSS